MVVTRIATAFLSMYHAPKSYRFFVWAASIVAVFYITASYLVDQFERCFLHLFFYLFGRAEPSFRNTTPGISEVQEPTVRDENGGRNIPKTCPIYSIKPFKIKIMLKNICHHSIYLV